MKKLVEKFTQNPYITINFIRFKICWKHIIQFDDEVWKFRKSCASILDEQLAVPLQTV